MRILVLSSVFPNSVQPALGIFVRNRVRRLVHFGEVVVVAPVPWFPFNRWFRGVRGSQLPAEEMQDGLRIYHPRFVCTPGLGKCFDGIFYFFSILCCVCRLRKQFNFDFIDAHFSYPDGVGGALLSKFLRMPVFITVRGTHDIRHSRYRLRKPQIQLALLSAAKVFCVSESLKRFVCELGVIENRVTVVPNGIDEREFYPMNRQVARQQVGLPNTATILLSVGAYIEGKGHQRVVELLPDLLEQFPNLLLVMLGEQRVDVKYVEILKEEICRRNLQRNVLLVPTQPHSNLRFWLNAADLFCLATRSEGRCNAILEALACGLAVVTTDVGGNRELVEHGRDGLLVPFWNKEAFLEAVCRGLREKWDDAAISQKARRVTWEETTNSIVKQFEQQVSRIIASEGGVQAF